MFLYNLNTNQYVNLQKIMLYKSPNLLKILIIHDIYYRNSKKKMSGASNYKSSSFLTEESVSIDVNAATFLDVAVLRCLFVRQWCEEGVYWAFQFLYHRYVLYNDKNK